jgi:Na+-driven multidrug efflux pump
MATAISNLAATVFFLIYLLRRGTTVLGIRPSDLRYGRQHLRTVLAVGFPSALQYALTVVAVAAQARFVSHYATEAVAALGIIKKLDNLPLYFAIGTSSGLLPLLAYNYASGNQERRRRAFRFGCGVAVGFALLCVALYECLAPQLAGLFIDDAATIHYAAGFLRRMVLAMPMMAVCYPMIIQFQAMGKARESLVCSILRKGVLDIPLLFLMDHLLPLYGCMWVQPMVDTISLVVATAFYVRLKRREGL